MLISSIVLCVLSKASKGSTEGDCRGSVGQSFQQSRQDEENPKKTAEMFLWDLE